MNAAVEAIPVTVSQTAFSWTAGGVWTLVFIVIGALVRFGPALAKLIFDRNAQKESHAHQAQRDNFHDCQQQLDATNKRLDTVTEKFDALQLTFNDLKAELQGAVSAYRLLDAEVESLNPGSLALRQARMLMSVAFTVSRPPTQEIQEAAERAIVRLDASTHKEKPDADQP